MKGRLYNLKVPPPSGINRRFKNGIKSIAVLDRCGNNWRNGKGGFGILMHDEYAPCCATMFQPFIVITNTSGEAQSIHGWDESESHASLRLTVI